MSYKWLHYLGLSLVLSLAFSVLAAPAAQAKPEDPIGPVEVSGAVYFDVSGPMSDLVGVAPAADTDKEKKEKPLRVLPNMGNAVNQVDTAEQTAVGPLVSTTGGLNFAGVGQGDYGFNVTSTLPRTPSAPSAPPSMYSG